MSKLDNYLTQVHEAPLTRQQKLRIYTHKQTPPPNMTYMYQRHMRPKTYNHHCCSKHREYRKVKHVNLYKIYEGAFYSVTATKRPLAALCNPLVQCSSHSSSLVQKTGSLTTPFPTQPQQNTWNLNTLEVRLEWSKTEFPHHIRTLSHCTQARPIQCQT